MIYDQMTQALSVAGTPQYPQVLNNATIYTGWVDMSKFERVMFLLAVGTLTNGSSVTMTLQVSPDQSTINTLAGTTTNAVVATSKLETVEIRAGQIGLVATGSANRYVRAKITESAGVNSYVCCIPLTGGAKQEPGNASDDGSVFQRLVLLP